MDEHRNRKCGDLQGVGYAALVAEVGKRDEDPSIFDAFSRRASRTSPHPPRRHDPAVFRSVPGRRRRSSPSQGGEDLVLPACASSIGNTSRLPTMSPVLICHGASSLAHCSETDTRVSPRSRRNGERALTSNINDTIVLYSENFSFGRFVVRLPPNTTIVFAARLRSEDVVERDLSTGP